MSDVLILGGGLAGLTLALQLRKNHPELPITVLERRRGEAPEAAFKIGESTVELAGHYFANVLGLREHLDAQQIVKFGFRFFFSDARHDLDRCAELGASEALPTGSWQIDRGRFENFLTQRVRDQGIELIDGASVKRIDLSETGEVHRVEYERDGERLARDARWVVDASGRAGLIRRQRDLKTDNGHHANSAWFRINARLDPHDWSEDESWKARCMPPERWRSTNHLVGPGYWVWLIPLSSGSHSVGIVCDAEAHPIDGMKSFDLAMEWFRQHQPRLHQALEHHRDGLQDFAFFKHFSYGCKQLFSPQRWALTGEAGAFLDPFYSPGSDFIGISNTYIATLIGKDLAGEAWEPYAAVYEQLFLSFYDSTLAMYRGQYHLFGDAEVLPLKVLWDYSYYWGVLAALFFAGRIGDLTTLSRLKPELAEARALNDTLQAMFADWGHRNGVPNADTCFDREFLDQASVDWFAELNRGLKDELDDSAFRQRLRDNVERLRQLALELRDLAVARHPDIDASAIRLPDSGTNHAPLLPMHWHDAQGGTAVGDPALLDQ